MTSTSGVLVLLQAVMAILIVDFAGSLVREIFVRFGDFDEFLVGGFISTSWMSVRFHLWGE